MNLKDTMVTGGAFCDRRSVLKSIGASAMVLSGAAALAQTAAPLRKVTVGEITRSGSSWVRVVAGAKGYFKDEGLEIDPIVIQGGPPAIVQQVVAGAIDIGVSNFDLFIRGVEAKAPVTMIGSSMLKIPFSLIAAPSIKTPADLKGKTVSVSSPKDPTALLFNRWLRENGMQQSDVDIIYVGATPDRLAALMNGAVVATALTQPFDFRAIDRGFVRMADFGRTATKYGFLAFGVRTDWLKKNADVARGFLKAERRATDWLLDPANKKEAIDILAKDIRQDPALVEKMYDYYSQDLKPYSADLSIPDDYIKGNLEMMVEAKELKEPLPPVSKYVDLQYLPR